MKKIPLTSTLLAALLATQPLQAQRHEIFSPRIATLQVVAGNDWQSIPLAPLGGQPINIDFDDMTHDYHRYTYKIEHCDAQWHASQDLFESDFSEGFNGELTVDDSEQSLNTNHLYTHYHLSIPNDNCRLTMGGNYKLTIYDDSKEEESGNKVLTACFMLLDAQTEVTVGYTTNTDIDTNKSHQQVSLGLKYGNLRVSDPTRQVKTVVLQNGRWDNAVANAHPDYVSADGMRWEHARSLIFDAGNVYRKFETLDLGHPTMGVDEIRWDGNEYHVLVEPDLPRPSYLHDVSARGSFYVRNSDNTDNDFTCDYAQVSFRLQSDRLPQGEEVYLNGDWTYDSFLPQYRMRYDDADRCYHATVPLKQGYYSYQYLVLCEDGSTRPVASEGNFWQTANRYDVLVYYRGNGDRTDRLVGWNHCE